MDIPKPKEAYVDKGSLYVREIVQALTTFNERGLPLANQIIITPTHTHGGFQVKDEYRHTPASVYAVIDSYVTSNTIDGIHVTRKTSDDNNLNRIIFERTPKEQ